MVVFLLLLSTSAVPPSYAVGRRVSVVISSAGQIEQLSAFQGNLTTIGIALKFATVRDLAPSLGATYGLIFANPGNWSAGQTNQISSALSNYFNEQRFVWLTSSPNYYKADNTSVGKVNGVLAGLNSSLRIGSLCGCQSLTPIINPSFVNTGDPADASMSNVVLSNSLVISRNQQTSIDSFSGNVNWIVAMFHESQACQSGHPCVSGLPDSEVILAGESVIGAGRHGKIFVSGTDIISLVSQAEGMKLAIQMILSGIHDSALNSEIDFFTALVPALIVVAFALVIRHRMTRNGSTAPP